MSQLCLYCSVKYKNMRFVFIDEHFSNNSCSNFCLKLVIVSIICAISRRLVLLGDKKIVFNIALSGEEI